MITTGEIEALGEGVLSTSVATLLTVRDGASVFVSLITLVSKDTVNRTCNLYVDRGAGRRLIAPKDLTLRPGYMVELDRGITLKAGHKLEASASVADVVEYTINGFERAV